MHPFAIACLYLILQLVTGHRLAFLGDGGTIKSQLTIQVVHIAITVLKTAVAGYAILQFVAMGSSLRVDNDAETEGLDLTQHGAGGYHNNQF